MLYLTKKVEFENAFLELKRPYYLVPPTTRFFHFPCAETHLLRLILSLTTRGKVTWVVIEISCGPSESWRSLFNLGRVHVSCSMKFPYPPPFFNFRFLMVSIFLNFLSYLQRDGCRSWKALALPQCRSAWPGRWLCLQTGGSPLLHRPPVPRTDCLWCARRATTGSPCRYQQPSAENEQMNASRLKELDLLEQTKFQNKRTKEKLWIYLFIYSNFKMNSSFANEIYSTLVHKVAF